jgi:hypothetical protein
MREWLGHSLAMPLFLYQGKFGITPFDGIT